MDRRLPALFALLTLVLPGSAGAEISYPDFTDATGLTLNGITTIAGPVLRVTPTEFFVVGTAFVTAPVTLEADGSFSTSFSFRVHSNSGTSDVDGVGGSGVAFLMQRDGPNVLADTLPTGYGAYGNEFRPRSVTVKFDTYDNSVTNCHCNDVSGNFVGLMLDGSYDSVAQTNYPTRFNDGATFYAWIDYDGSADTLEVRVSETAVRPVSAMLVHSFDLIGLLGGTEVWVGFGTFTGTSASTHDIQSWWFSSDSTVPQIKSVGLSSAVVAGCKSVTGAVTLTAPAPVGGLVVSLSDTLSAATVPATMKFQAGATTKSFTVTTTPVAIIQSGTVSATLSDKTLSQNLAVRPMSLSSLTLSPTTVIGSQPVAGKATLECKAGPGPVEVVLESSKPTVANPVAPSIFVPQGVQSATFDITTNPVPAKTTVSIKGTANGISKSKSLTVTPAASVSATRLAFGNQAVGTTSASLSVALTNKGAVPFSVTGISLTGTYASWFAFTEDCPDNLPAGTSCTISVTFAPQAAASKSAKLSITTSATSTPLSVSLSGTGVLLP